MADDTSTDDELGAGLPRPVLFLIAILVPAGAALASPGLTKRIPNLSVDATREIGGAIIAGVVVGVFLLLWEEHLEQRRDARDHKLADAQAERDEDLDAAQAERDTWTASIIQLSALGTNLGQIDMRERDLHGLMVPASAQLSGARFNKANLRWSYMRTARVGGAAFCGADLTGSNLIGIRGPRVDFTDADLTAVDLSGAALESPVFVGAVLDEVNLHGAELLGPNFAGADLSGAFHEGAPPTVSGAILDDSTRLPGWWRTEWNART